MLSAEEAAALLRPLRIGLLCGTEQAAALRLWANGLLLDRLLDRLLNRHRRLLLVSACAKEAAPTLAACALSHWSDWP